jgi:hypothetical protein
MRARDIVNLPPNGQEAVSVYESLSACSSSGLMRTE